jgi:predicted phosphodiesterase
MTAPRLDDTLDLGAIEPPILVFGGPYSNLHATLALRAAADRLRIPAERTLCTGDVVAYGGDPEETTALIRDWSVHVARGNCEDSLAAAADTCGCGFPEDSACDRLSRMWYGLALNALSRSSRAWMASLPGRITFDLGGVRVTVLHASVDDPSRFIFASTEIEPKRSDLIRLDANVVIAGHSGLPFAQPIDGRLWLNAGVIGQPANDGTPDAWYSLIDVVDGRLHVRFRRLSYDHRGAAATMRGRGLPDAYADALTTGLWPSCEILPPAEAAARGRPLALDREPLTFRLKTDGPRLRDDVF